ncbi:Rv3654c family TadE-like protein, partial [Tenggerimyces flavus]
MRERGSGTVLALGLGAVLIVGGLVGMALATVIAATHRVDAAADLAALSAARLLVEGEEEACAKARSVAVENGVELESCQTANLIVDVVVRARTARLFGTSLTVRARARAGPSTIEQQREGATQRADRTRDRLVFRQPETSALEEAAGSKPNCSRKVAAPAGRETLPG